MIRGNGPAISVSEVVRAGLMRTWWRFAESCGVSGAPRMRPRDPGKGRIDSTELTAQVTKREGVSWRRPRELS